MPRKNHPNKKKRKQLRREQQKENQDPPPPYTEIETAGPSTAPDAVPGPSWAPDPAPPYKTMVVLVPTRPPKRSSPPPYPPSGPFPPPQPGSGWSVALPTPEERKRIQLKTNLFFPDNRYVVYSFNQGEIIQDTPLVDWMSNSWLLAQTLLLEELMEQCKMVFVMTLTQQCFHYRGFPVLEIERVRMMSRMYLFFIYLIVCYFENLRKLYFFLFEIVQEQAFYMIFFIIISKSKKRKP